MVEKLAYGLGLFSILVETLPYILGLFSVMLQNLPYWIRNYVTKIDVMYWIEIFYVLYQSWEICSMD
jgi:hypothetical protein